MNWLHYLLEANIYLAVFYAGYCLFLNKETHYTLNRAYLLLTCVVSFIIPMIQVSWLKTAETAVTTSISYQVGQPTQGANSLSVSHPTVVHQFNYTDILWGAYLIGILVMAILLIVKLLKLFNLAASGKRLIDNRYKVVDIRGTDTAFSFLNYLFIGTKISGSDTIIRHELVHIKQKHSFDILFIELLKVFNWFNPLIYLLQVSFKTLHEYIADEQTAAQEGDALTYSSFLVNNAYGLSGSSITHSFFNYNLLKKRIIMLNQKRSGKLARLKYLFIVPVSAGMLCASTLAFSKNYALVDLAPTHTQTTLPVLAHPGAKNKLVKDTPALPPSPFTEKVITVPVAPVQINKATKHLPPAALPVAMQSDTLTTPDAFYKYMAKTVRYPAVEHDKLIGGRVIIAFDIVGGKITDSKIVRTLTPTMDGEVLRSVKAFNGSIDLKNGCYQMPISFSVLDDKGNPIGHLPEPPDATEKSTDVYVTPKPFVALSEILIVSYPYKQ